MRRETWPKLSFEFFPPAREAAQDRLVETAERLDGLDPAFMSVTYGAGGSTRDRTVDVLEKLTDRIDAPVAGHLTCVGQTRAEAHDVARRYWSAGIRHIVALRGDRPDVEEGDDIAVGQDGYRYASELVAGVRDITPFEISVAAYPEVHPEALSPAADLDNLKRKIDAGASRAITQYCFETDTVLRFLEECAAVGIERTIVPGILPIGDFAKVRAFSEKCGAGVPDWLKARFETVADDPVAARELAIDTACRQVDALFGAGIREFHFYTLNRADLTEEICTRTGLVSEEAVRTRRNRNAA